MSRNTHTPQLAATLDEIAARHWARTVAGEQLDKIDRRILVNSINERRGFATVVLAIFDGADDRRLMVAQTTPGRLHLLVGEMLSGAPRTATPGQGEAPYTALVTLAAQAAADGVPDTDRVGALVAAGLVAWWAGMSPDAVLEPVDEARAINSGETLAAHLQLAACAAKRVLSSLGRPAL